jgi:hypothetical protein
LIFVLVFGLLGCSGEANKTKQDDFNNPQSQSRVSWEKVPQEFNPRVEDVQFRTNQIEKLNVNIFGSRKIILFKRKNHAFVLSTIKNELNELYYTFEIIANIPFNYTSKYISDSSLLKVQDIITKVNPELNLNFKIIK